MTSATPVRSIPLLLNSRAATSTIRFLVSAASCLDFRISSFQVVPSKCYQSFPKNGDIQACEVSFKDSREASRLKLFDLNTVKRAPSPAPSSNGSVGSKPVMVE